VAFDSLFAGVSDLAADRSTPVQPSDGTDVRQARDRFTKMILAKPPFEAGAETATGAEHTPKTVFNLKQ
jgi:hypothetical protein